MTASSPPTDRDTATAIWAAAVDAVRPRSLFAAHAEDLCRFTEGDGRILVVGGGKAGAQMAAALEDSLSDRLDRIEGLVNVPQGSEAKTRRVRARVARPAGSNFPTEEGVLGTDRMLELLARAGPEDVAVCLISGGGSALLPAPVEGVTLDEKSELTRRLHASGATIGEMNRVRKHLSRVKGGGLARAFAGKALLSLIISDVVGDPLDVIASGPTVPDPTTYGDAIDTLRRHGIWDDCPGSIRDHLTAGERGSMPETLKSVPERTRTLILGNNPLALTAAEAEARSRGWNVLNLGSYLEGDAAAAGILLAGLVRSVRADARPAAAPLCVLFGGETTVNLPPDHGRGGRNQHFVLSVLSHLGPDGCDGVTVLSGGTDGEDGPTDAAGAIADADTWRRANSVGFDPRQFLERRDAYPFFDTTEGLIRIGLTGTNVMDVGVILVH